MATRVLPHAYPVAPARPAPPNKGLIDAAVMLGLAVLLRCWWYGDPVVQIDEQFYLLVGDRMLHGAIPYVDIWDRKPIGLFLLYAGIRLLGGDGIVQYQLMATLFAAITAFLVTRMARGFAGGAGARAAGAASLVWTIVFDGAGGQSPVFYNPLMAGAAAIVLGALLRREEGTRPLILRGALAMALVGLAIQIKYTAMFEGMIFGLVLLWIARRRGIGGAIVPAAALWITLAVLPTVAALLWYWRAGHLGAFFYANFDSIGARIGSPAATLARRLGVVIALGLPLIVAAAAGARRQPIGTQARIAHSFAIVWAAGAVVGFGAIGTLYKHYFLPVVPPLALLAAPMLGGVGRSRWRPALVLAPGLLLAAATSFHRGTLRGGERDVADEVAAIRPHLRDRLFVFDGEPILYHLTGAALASPYAFPSHLNAQREAPAIGRDPAAEVRRVMATRPSVVVTSDRPARDGNLRTWPIVAGAMAQDYVRVAQIRLHDRWRYVYALKPGLAAAG